MVRLMADPAFRQEQHSLLQEPHIAPISAYVDTLRADGRWMPYVAPLHGGVEARLLSVARDPGPKTQDATGSGMLCVENDDQTAANQFDLLDAAGLRASDYNPWNAYPWYINAAPDRKQIREGADAFAGLIDLMPSLEVIMLQGKDARDAWRVVLENHPDLHQRRLIVFETYHASNQALWSQVPGERERRIEHRLSRWREAGRVLAGSSG